MKKLSQPFDRHLDKLGTPLRAPLVLSIILVLTFGLIAGASQKLPHNAQLIVTGQNTLLLNQLANHVGGKTQLEALIGVDDDLLTSGER